MQSKASKPSDLRLILASGSPRRQELLTQAGYDFRVVIPGPEAEDGLRAGEAAQDYVRRLAQQKAADVARRVGTAQILACDTVAECQGEILGKPRDRDHARQMLHALSGRRHRVHSGLCLWDYPAHAPRLAVDTTVLFMTSLSDAQIEEYLATGLWEGKAGAFGYQDRQGWLTIESGSESNVVGLPLELLARLLPVKR